MGQIQEFLQFLKEYNVVAMAIAFMIGVASQDLVQSFVNDIVMPFVDPFIAADAWQEATVMIGPAEVRWGAFLAALLNFTIIALVVFLAAKKVLGEAEVEKR